MNHLRQPTDPEVARGVSYVDFDPDRVALQDALAQVVLLQFMLAGLEETAVPTTVHCDHLIQANRAVLSTSSVVSASSRSEGNQSARRNRCRRLWSVDVVAVPSRIHEGCAAGGSVSSRRGVTGPLALVGRCSDTRRFLRSG